jgi:transcription initiation factor TFIIIB Brf1 subunit/transcription initiation factor TFIIB
MMALANQLRIPEQTVNNAIQIFKLAAMTNFIQGRRMDMVASVCLYSAARKEKPCNVMLIDFADKVQVCYLSSVDDPPLILGRSTFSSSVTLSKLYINQ